MRDDRTRRHARAAGTFSLARIAYMALLWFQGVLRQGTQAFWSRYPLLSSSCQEAYIARQGHLIPFMTHDSHCHYNLLSS
ncbi:uncharacterized protein EI97DRAFT_227341 [Westerdykella ornata]|uniref:Uncharacterized protein n=1 Tax=Westerdykella ornata TaxID=318751 RepID=A0A6A6JVL1_WESOR|nr:uncharacterized protein EI97DRAFT_227341 [Westerdykella ornata]KAF2279089.1 hypothetical protein EI97DRAFT_227341 [Westerdykella ornata]